MTLLVAGSGSIGGLTALVAKKIPQKEGRERNHT
jgi:hypothetical protein